MGVPVGSALQIREVSAAPTANPPSGSLLLYAGSDGNYGSRDSSGSLKAVGGDYLCTATTRPSSPLLGQRIYETDTLVERVWDGSKWRAVGWETFLFNAATNTVQPITPANDVARTGWITDGSVTGTENNGWSFVAAGAWAVPADGIYDVDGIVTVQGVSAADNVRFVVNVVMGNSAQTPVANGTVGTVIYTNSIVMGNRYIGLNWGFKQRFQSSVGHWLQIVMSTSSTNNDTLNTVQQYASNGWSMTRVGV